MSWKTIWSGEVEPFTHGEISYGKYAIVQEFQREPRKRPSRGWRKHLRRLKAKAKRK